MKTIEYRVKSGDSLSLIARRHNLTEDALSRMNDISELDLRRIRPGQVLQIPLEGQATQRAPVQSRTDRVRAGDTWSTIAQRNKVTAGALALANGINDLTQKLVLGRTLKVPTASGPDAAKEQPTAQGADRKLVPSQKKAGQEQSSPEEADNGGQSVVSGLSEDTRIEKHSPLSQQVSHFGSTRLLVAASSPFLGASLLASRVSGNRPSNDPKIDYPIKVPQGVKTEEDLDRYAEVMIFGRVVGIRWTSLGWNVSDLARQGKIVHYLYPSSEVSHFGGRDVNRVVRPSARSPVYETIQGMKRRALGREIDRRYWAGTGLPPGQRINTGDQAKEDMWNYYRDEVMRDDQQLKALPPELKALMGGEARFEPVNYNRLLRIAEKLKHFSPEDTALFKTVAVLTTHDLDLLERSINLFLARKEELHQRSEEAQRRSQGTTPETMEAAIERSWAGADLSKVGKLSYSDQYALARDQTTEATKTQFAYMASHPGEVAVDFAKAATLMNSSETFAAIGKELAEATNGDANSWARWAAGTGAGAKLSGWLLAAAGVLFVLSWLTGVGELATITALMGRLFFSAMILSVMESELRIFAASRAKTPAEFKDQVNKAAAARLNWLIMLAMTGLALAIRFIAKTYFPQTVKNLQTTLTRLRERIRLVGRLADKKAEIVTEMRKHRTRLEQEGRAAKSTSSAQADALEAMTLDEFVAEMENGELMPEAQLREGQKIPWKQIGSTPEGLKAIEACRQRLVIEIRSGVLEEIDALVKEQTDAIDVTLDKVSKATLPNELSQALAEHEGFLGEDEVAARAKVREQRALQRAAEAELGFTDPPPPELRTLAEILRSPISETDPVAIKTRRFEVIREVRNVHGSEQRPPKYEGYVSDKILAENQAALARSRAALHSMKPDVIVGMERGGSFLTEALTHEDPVLASKVRKMRVHKAPEGQPSKFGKYDGPKMEAEFQALINDGAKQIVIYDAYMGGRTARSLINQVFKPLRARYPEVNFHMYWLRETFGFRGVEVVGSKKVIPGVQTTIEEVTLVLGDDMDVVMSPDGQSPIRIFNSKGQVTRIASPQPGQSTRQVMIKLLNSSPSRTQPSGSSALPILPAPPVSRSKKH